MVSAVAKESSPNGSNASGAKAAAVVVFEGDDVAAVGVGQVEELVGVEGDGVGVDE